MVEQIALRGQKVLISGGTTGLGRETVKLLVAQGARVVTFGRDEAHLREVLGQVAQGGEVHGPTGEQHPRQSSMAMPMQECSEEEQRQAVARKEMLEAAELAEAIAFVASRSSRVDVVNLRFEPRLQKTA